MAEAPKVVQERLRVASAGASRHPDADVLTAFAERSLRGLERDEVLEHLSRCGECREVVSLALPESQLVEVAVQSARAPWLTWPAMRWGFAAAGIVVVAALAIVHRRQPSMAAEKTPPPAAVSEARNQAVPAPSLEDTKKQQDNPKASPLPTGNKGWEEAWRAPTPLAHNGVAAAPAPIPSYADRLPVAGSLAHGPKMGMQANLSHQWQQSSANNFAPPVPVSPATPPAPAANQEAVFASSDAVVQTQAAAPVQTADSLAVQSQGLSRQLPPGGSTESKVDRAKPLETVIVDNSRKYAVGAAPSASRVRSAVAGAAQWTINSTGGLQRSLDRGATWQDVNVNQSDAPGGANKEQSSEQAPPKDQSQASSEPVFRAVAANGPDVWAGGANARLYHSVDTGVHWTRIVPLSSGISLTGDIVTVDFPDPQHGRVATSTSEIWLTGDAGQSWQKQ